MKESYFNNFPVISYANNLCINITERTALLNKIYNNPNLYYQYDIAQGERPDSIAARYYSNPYKAWMLYFSNKTLDPYYGWYMDQDTFNNFLTTKYGSVQNAMTKTAFYRNNWYNNIDPISVSSYTSLDSDLQKFYIPNYGNDPYSTNILNYVRLREDWTLTTNQIVNYTVASNPNFIVDEIVDVYYNGNATGYAQVVYSGTNQVSVQHTNGIVVGTITGICQLIGRESGNTISFTAASSISSSIPSIEINYWSPVSYYDFENEKNESNKSIQVLNTSYTDQLLSQMKNLL